MAKILVTGGAGFIGSHIVDALVGRGHEVVVIDDLSSGNKKNVNSRAKLVIGSINDNLDEVFEKEKFEYVFHLAAQINVRKSLESPLEDAKTNIIGGLNVIENCAKYGVKKIIFSSTGGAIYSPDAEIPCNEGSKIEPLSPYGLAKYTIENYLRIMKNIKGLDYTALRYSNVYGPRQNAKGEAGVVAIFINNILDDKGLKIFGDGEQTRDFVYVKDVARANVLALNLSGVYNVASETETSVNELCEMIKKLMESNVDVEHTDAVKGELMRSCLSAGKLKKHGWDNGYNLEKGLKETIEWFMGV